MVKIETKVNVKDIKENKRKVFWIILISISFICLAFAFTYDAEQETPSEMQQEIPQETTTYEINDTKFNISIAKEAEEKGFAEAVTGMVISWLPIWIFVYIAFGLIKKLR